MRSSFSIRSVAVLLALAVALSMFAIPALAFATPARGPVPNHPTVGSVDLGGMTEADALAAILAAVAAPGLPTLNVTAADSTFAFNPVGAVIVDAVAMLDQAYDPAAPGAFALVTKYRVDSTAVVAFVAGVGAAVDRAPVNSNRVMSGYNLVITPSAAGRALDRAGAAAALTARLLAEAAGGSTTSALALSISPVAASVNEWNIGRTIVVNLKQRRVYLFNGGAIERVYKCAIGQKRYPTPTGDWRITGKQEFPTWTNPGSRWARKMPKRIKPGVNNPLGTRALYLNASGIRIHGTNKNGSVGSAVSHGCMRMVRRDIEALYPLVPVGTPVFIRK